MAVRNTLANPSGRRPTPFSCPRNSVVVVQRARPNARSMVPRGGPRVSNLRDEFFRRQARAVCSRTSLQRIVPADRTIRRGPGGPRNRSGVRSSTLQGT